jgi:trimethylamine--corrinoid protein Co-methyltransferase
MKMTSGNEGLRIRYFSDEQVRRIHENALDLLETHGFKVEHQSVLEMIRDAGGEVDFEKQIARVKPDTVTECIEAGPSHFVLGARDPERSVKVETCPRFPVIRNGGGVDNIVDMETGEHRKMTMADVAGVTKALDAMEGVSCVSPLYGQDVPEDIRDLMVLETLFNHTTKHVNIRTFSRVNLEILIKMGEIVAGSREALRRNPVFSLFDSPLSPLRFPQLTVDVFITAGRYGIPVFTANLPIAGATGPFTLAGMVQLLHAETLASVVICQLANPGAPVMTHPLAMTMDWSTSLSLSGSIESTMITAGAVQVIVESLNMPVDVHGPWSDTYTADSQSMLERTFQTVFTAYAGASSVAGFGDVQEGLAFCPIQLGIDEELIGYLMKSFEGIPVDDHRLSLDAIKRVGFDGNFMTDETTLNYLRTDYYQPKILNRLSREDWERSGRKEINAAARDRMNKLMVEHQPVPLEDAAQREIRSLVENAA